MRCLCGYIHKQAEQKDKTDSSQHIEQGHYVGFVLHKSATLYYIILTNAFYSTGYTQEVLHKYDNTDFKQAKYIYFPVYMKLSQII